MSPRVRTLKAESAPEKPESAPRIPDRRYSDYEDYLLAQNIDEASSERAHRLSIFAYFSNRRPIASCLFSVPAYLLLALSAVEKNRATKQLTLGPIAHHISSAARENLPVLI